MIPGLIIVFGSLLPMLLLNIIYFLQQKKLVVTSKSFFALCLINFISMILELLDPYLFHQGFTAIGTFSLKVQWSLGIVFYFFLFTYIFLFINQKLEYKDLKEMLLNERKMIFLVIATITLILLLLILPFSVDVTKADNYFPYPHALFSLTYGGFLAIALIVQVIKVKELTKEAKTLLLSTVILAAIYIIIQNILKEVALAQVVLYFILFLIYIIVENPDKYMVEEINKTKNSIVKSNNINKLIIKSIKDNSAAKTKELNNILSKYSNGIGDNNYKEDFEKIYTTLKNINYTIENRLSLLTNKEDNEQNIFEIIDIANKAYLLSHNEINSNIKYQLTILDNTPKKIKCNYNTVLYVLLNSINFAIKNTTIGKITISIGSNTMDNKNYLTIKCRDTGNGMEEKIYNNLRQSIVNDDYSTKVDSDIVCISKRLEVVGGRLSIDTTEDVGTTLISYIPYTKVNDEVHESTTINEVENNISKIITYNDKKLLLVDSNYNMINKLLDLYKIDVDKTLTVEEAINKIKQDINYEWIFINIADETSIKMVSLLQDLVKNFDYKMPYLVALMPYRNNKYIQIFNDNKFDNYLIEPLEIEELNKVLEKDNK